MAKGKSTGYKSKGERPNVAKDIRKTMRREYSNSSEQLLNKFTAFTKGKRVMTTIPIQIRMTQNIVLFVFL